MPSDAATWMSTAARIAATPSRIWAISRSSGPRTAATMQNSVAPVAAVCLAASTSAGMSSQTARTGDVNRPGLRAEVAVLGAAAGLQRDDALDLDLGAAPRIRTWWAASSAVGDLVVGQPQDGQHVGLVEPGAGLEDARHSFGQVGSREVKHARTLQGVMSTIMPTSDAGWLAGLRRAAALVAGGSARQRRRPRARRPAPPARSARPTTP